TRASRSSSTPPGASISSNNAWPKPKPPRPPLRRAKRRNASAAFPNPPAWSDDRSGGLLLRVKVAHGYNEIGRPSSTRPSLSTRPLFLGRLDLGLPTFDHG